MASRSKVKVKVKDITGEMKLPAVKKNGGDASYPVPFDPAQLAKELRAAPGPSTSGMPYLNMTKGGMWTVGQDKTPVTPGTRWALNPAGFVHGIVAWRDTTGGAKAGKVAEELCPISQPLPKAGPVPVGAREWATELGCGLKALKGGAEVRYVVNSDGGTKAVKMLRDIVAAQLESDPQNCVALIELSSSNYPHPSYGTIFKPQFNIVGWTSYAALAPAKGK